MDTSLEVDIDFINVEAFLPTLACWPSCTFAFTFSSQAPSASTFHQLAKIIQAMILEIGNLSHLANVRATQLEASISWMIESDLVH